jgi:hypothetical protein
MSVLQREDLGVAVHLEIPLKKGAAHLDLQQKTAAVIA